MIFTCFIDVFFAHVTTFVWVLTVPHITIKMINTSIVTNVFPKLWKHSIIIPIYKSGGIEEPTNFRPINLLPILSKILEKVISTQLTKYLKKKA